MYSLRDYGDMVADQRRTDSYVEALRHAVKPGSVVLDIGTGTGILAMAACRFGARRVYAVEPSDVVHLAREIAEANGLSDRIEFIAGLSTELELPERADVVVAEIHGLLPLFETSLATLIDARQRLLAAGGVIIPARETIYASVVEAAETHRRLVSPWVDSPQGFDMGRGLSVVTSEIHRTEFAARDLMASPAIWVTLDYATIRDTNVEGTISLEVQRTATAHGLGLWFDSTLIDGVEMSNAPGKPALVFGNAFLPWPEAVALKAGDRVEVGISANLLGERYLWRWKSRVSRADGSVASFDQSRFHAVPIPPQMLRRTCGD